MTETAAAGMPLTYLSYIRIDIGNPIGMIIFSIVVTLAVTGIVYLVLSTIVEKIILPIMNVPREKRGDHILSTIAMIIAFVVLAAGIVTIVLPAFGVDTGFLAAIDPSQGRQPVLV